MAVTKKKVEINDFNLTLKIVTSWGEMDAFGHINNSVFFRYFENIRIKYFQQCQILFNEESAIKPILSETHCKFIKPIYFPQSIIACAKTLSFTNNSFTMQYAIFESEDKSCIALGTGTITSFNYNTKKRSPLPKKWRSSIEKIDSFLKNH